MRNWQESVGREATLPEMRQQLTSVLQAVKSATLQNTALHNRLTRMRTELLDCKRMCRSRGVEIDALRTELSNTKAMLNRNRREEKQEARQQVAQYAKSCRAAVAAAEARAIAAAQASERRNSLRGADLQSESGSAESIEVVLQYPMLEHPSTSCGQHGGLRKEVVSRQRLELLVRWCSLGWVRRALCSNQCNCLG